MASLHPKAAGNTHGQSVHTGHQACTSGVSTTSSVPTKFSHSHTAKVTPKKSNELASGDFDDDNCNGHSEDFKLTPNPSSPNFNVPTKRHIELIDLNTVDDPLPQKKLKVFHEVLRTLVEVNIYA